MSIEVVDPQREPSVTRLLGHVREGALDLGEAEATADGLPRYNVVVGAQLARNMNFIYSVTNESDLLLSLLVASGKGLAGQTGLRSEFGICRPASRSAIGITSERPIGKPSIGRSRRLRQTEAMPYGKARNDSGAVDRACKPARGSRVINLVR